MPDRSGQGVYRRRSLGWYVSAMRRILVTVLALPLALSLAGCVTGRADGSAKIQTSQEANRENLQGAAAAPLRDLNVVRTKIPEVLLQAMTDPYARPPRGLRVTRAAQCEQLAQLIRPLNDALGADLDTPSKDQDDLLVKGRDTALGAMAGFASDAIPFRGWVRQLSGAEQHDRQVQAAITAGAVRRAYLKGLGESRGCNPPATPSHVLTPAAAQPTKTSGLRPLYPTR
jgi:hypothetical protein